MRGCAALFFLLRFATLLQLLREAGSKFLVLHVIEREGAEHVIRSVPIPVLPGIVVGNLCGPTEIAIAVSRADQNNDTDFIAAKV